MDETELERLRRELESLVNKTGGHRRFEQPYAAELEYHLSRLNTAIASFSWSSLRASLYSRDASAELLAQLDTLLQRTEEIREIVGNAREVLLRPPPEEKPEGFVE